VNAPALEVSFLEDGAQPADRTAQELATFIGGAQRSLDIAIYDLNLHDSPADQLRDAIQAATARGVPVRLLHNVDFPNPIPVPPPSDPDTTFIQSLGVAIHAVAGVPALMHHKYVIRDGESVWTGSTNWTDDSWARQENLIVTVDSPELAHAFTLDEPLLVRVARPALLRRRREGREGHRSSSARCSAARRAPSVSTGR